jgi:hypothetical protein
MLTPYEFGQMVKRAFELGTPPHGAAAFTPQAPAQNQLPPMVAPQKAQPYQDPYQHPKYINTVNSLTKRDNAMQDFTKTLNPLSLGSAAYHNHMGGIHRIGEVIGNGIGDARNAIVNTFGGNNSGTPPAQ